MFLTYYGPIRLRQIQSNSVISDGQQLFELKPITRCFKALIEYGTLRD
jgi:hypothetical protein